jgi:thioredoxin-dependent peroxiredoxin
MPTLEGLVTYKDKPITLVGDGVVNVGDAVPDFRVSKGMEDDLHLSELRGKVVVLNVVPSIDTPICQSQTAKFNEAAAKMGTDVTVVTVSMDLPFAMRRWCEQHGVDLIVTSSDYKYHDFGKKFSLLMRGLGLLARSVFVVDKQGRLVHKDIVANMDHEPNYDAAYAAVAKARG